jgi:hypothetical protein
VSVAHSIGAFTEVTVVDLFAGSGSGAIASVNNPGVPLLTFGSGTSVQWDAAAYSYGWSFTLSSAKTIKGVGIYDKDQNGLNVGYVVGIFTGFSPPSAVKFDASNQVEFMYVASGTSEALYGQWRRVDLTTAGKELPAGTYYLACVPNNSTGIDDLLKNVTDVSVASGASYEENLTLDGSFQPSTTSADGTGYFGPMIFFE